MSGGLLSIDKRGHDRKKETENGNLISTIQLTCRHK